MSSLKKLLGGGHRSGAVRYFTPNREADARALLVVD
jgi:hypothetical protein